MLPWKRKTSTSEGDPKTLSTVLANCVGSLKMLVIAPKEEKAVRYVSEIETHLQDSALGDGDAAQKIRSASEAFSRHQRESIEGIINGLDASLRTMVGTLDQALASGDRMASGVGATYRKLGSMNDLTTFDELKDRVTEEILHLAEAITEYRQSTLAIQEKYRRELEAMRETLDAAQLAAKVDSLTNLPNRTCHEYHLAATLEDVARGQKYALALLDLDGFKNINDTLGHMAGDTALVYFTRALCKFLGRNAFVARLGGDEFTVIVEGPGEQLEKRLTDFRAKLAQNRLDLGSASMPLSISFGVIDLVTGGTYRSIMKEADERMYAYKRAAKSGRAA